MNLKIIKQDKLPQEILICCLPMVVLFMQLISDIGIAIILGAFVCAAFLPTKLKKPFLLFSLVIAGYLIWSFASVKIAGSFKNIYLAKIMSRFALIGYLLLFILWQLQQKTKPAFFHFGNMKKTIQFPLIWKGIKEPVWRFLLIFSSICSVCIIIFAFIMKPSFQTIIFGILFSIVNAVLEEFIWRGLILASLVDFANEKIALIISALSFGFYHISLGFPIWACLVFAIGGLYMSGAAIISKGLFAPITMHIIVNLIFVFIGIIF